MKDDIEGTVNKESSDTSCGMTKESDSRVEFCFVKRTLMQKSKAAGNEAASKPKKEKITYIDDGRSLADMSGVLGGFHFSKTNTSSNFKAQWDTYWGAVKMMFLPMLVVVGFLVVVYLIMTVIFGSM